MIEKYFEPWCFSADERPVEALFEYSDSMTKIASSLDYVPTIQRFVKTARPENGWYYLLIHAVGLDDVWGSNKNGDAFTKDQLVPSSPDADYGYKTFMTLAKGYVHHRNKPPFWTGQVLLSEFSPAMGRVELIVRYSIKRLIEEGAHYFVDMIEQGLLPATSMGCRVTYDICSICGNRARSRLEYCDHLISQKNMIMPDGRKVKMINYRPRFHDISLVKKPADPASRALLKIAEEVVPKSASVLKSAVIEKKIPTFSAGGLRRIDRNQYIAAINTKADPQLTLKKLMLLAKMDKHAAYTALTSAGIVLRPSEFFALEQIYLGNFTKAASALEQNWVCPVYEYEGSPYWFWKYANFDYRKISDEIGARSIYVPAIQYRFSEKRSSNLEEVYSDELANWSSAYSSYRSTAEKYLLDGTAVKMASNEVDILKSVMSSGIPLVVGLQELDRPRNVYEAYVTGGYLPTTTVV